MSARCSRRPALGQIADFSLWEARLRADSMVGASLLANSNVRESPKGIYFGHKLTPAKLRSRFPFTFQSGLEVGERLEGGGGLLTAPRRFAAPGGIQVARVLVLMAVNAQ